jgi:hypothetical protein
MRPPGAAHPGRRRLLAGVVIVALACGPGAQDVWALGAQLARTMSVKDEGSLRLIKSSGSTVTDEGPAHGTIPGKVRIQFLYDGDPTVDAQITIYGHSGAIQAHGSGRLSNPSSASPSFKGILTITGGTGAYRGAHGSGHFYGVFYRRTYAMTVQTEGKLAY